MEILNQSKRTFMVSTGILKPKQKITVPIEEGTTLIKMYDGEIIEFGNSAAEKENAELKAKIAELEEIATAPEKVKKSKKA